MLLPMLVVPVIGTPFDREINVLHLLAPLTIAAWLLRKIVVDRDLRLPRSGFAKPIGALLVIWVVTSITGYLFWDVRVPTDHRQPLFFVAEFGQLLLFIGVFYVTLDTVRDEKWILAVCAAAIAGKVLGVLFFGHLLYIQYPVVLGLVLAFLAFGKVPPGVKALLCVAIVFFAWDIWAVDRLPIYLMVGAIVLLVALLRSRRLFLVALAITVALGALYLPPLWQAESSVGSRLLLAKLALATFRDHPVFGVGPTQYRSYALIYHHGVGFGGWDRVETGLLLPHDVWLYFLACMGVTGALGILWLVDALFWTAWSAYRRATEWFVRTLAVALLAAVTGVLIQSAGGHVAFLPDYTERQIYMLPFWVLAGLMGARQSATARSGRPRPNDVGGLDDTIQR